MEPVSYSYDTQPVPEKDPDKELAFILNTYSSAVKLKLFGAASWQHIAGWDIQYQRNTISGYSFLLPAYRRFTTGAFWMTTYRPGPALSVSGGFRYDYGKIDASAYTDPYLAVYLRGRDMMMILSGNMSGVAMLSIAILVTIPVRWEWCGPLPEDTCFK